jgi:hypothetical protein
MKFFTYEHSRKHRLGNVKPPTLHTGAYFLWQKHDAFAVGIVTK